MYYLKPCSTNLYIIELKVHLIIINFRRLIKKDKRQD